MIPEPTIVDFGLAGLPKGLQYSQYVRLLWRVAFHSKLKGLLDFPWVDVLLDNQ